MSATLPGQPAGQNRHSLSASQQMAHSLLRRRHADKLAVLRIRVEDDPGCGLTSRLRSAEKLISNGDLVGAGEAMMVIDRLLADRSEQHAVNAAIAQTVKIARSRNEEVEIDGPTPRGAKKGEAQPIDHATGIRILNRDGLLWLKSKRRMDAAEIGALETYRRLFDRVHGASGADSTVAAERGPGGGGADPDSAMKRRVEAIWELDEAKAVLSHDQALLWLLDEVAGRGLTLRDLAKGEERVAGRLEVELRVAARLLAKFFGLRS